MNRIFLSFLIAALPLTASCQEEHQFSIEILDDEALQILDEDSEIEIVGSGFSWTEGPLWIADGSYLLFSDIPNNKVFKLDNKGEITEYLSPSGYMGRHFKGEEPGSNGLLLNQKGELILLQHGERRIARMDAPLHAPQPNYEVMVSHFENKRFNSPNDGVFDAKGNLYFTDPPYGLPKRMDDPEKEIDFQGVYCLMATGELVLVDTLTRPNGICFSPDNTKLYVAVSDPKHAVWYQYDIVAPGKISNKRLLYDVTDLVGQEGQQGLPDGMKMHSKNYLFATGPGGLWIFNKTGKPIARIHTGQATANCAFTSDEKTLYMTADDYVFKVALK
ncbi:SMP-30/gluconolactonase/LRE family protein [uncultured Kriegella sp.]|uniref:SMP-30/gluconolactonase/LRE family protein n=1 Tax=uncultured Kriegella sp. TaxID=1798910 RepID=UPI0030DD1668|tara:strand:+ start:30611 stop:31606 length:996 start_codon:yes stop_codon:yes gene_type:complete